MGKFFKDLKKGLEEYIAHTEGKIKLHSDTVVISKPPATYKAKEIKKIRESKKYSQVVFAQILNVSPKTVQSWEAGKRHPTSSALRLIELIDFGVFNPELHKRN